MGLEAAMTLHLALSVVTMPAFDTEMVCCSIASWIEVRSWGRQHKFLIYLVLGYSLARNALQRHLLQPWHASQKTTGIQVYGPDQQMAPDIILAFPICYLMLKEQKMNNNFCRRFSSLNYVH